jgi:hypothetical protein
MLDLFVQIYWVSGLCPSFGILNTRKQRFGDWIIFHPQLRGGGEREKETPTLLIP